MLTNQTVYMDLLENEVTSNMYSDSGWMVSHDPSANVCWVHGSVDCKSFADPQVQWERPWLIRWDGPGMILKYDMRDESLYANMSAFIIDFGIPNPDSVLTIDGMPMVNLVSQGVCTDTVTAITGYIAHPGHPGGNPEWNDFASMATMIAWDSHMPEPNTPCVGGG